MLFEDHCSGPPKVSKGKRSRRIASSCKRGDGAFGSMEGPAMLRQRAGQRQRLSSKTWRKVSVKGLRKKESRRQKEQQGRGGEGTSTGERMPWEG